MTDDYEIEEPADSYDDAIHKAADALIQAQLAYADSQAATGIGPVAEHLARANYFNGRAIALYQYAALIGPDN